MQALIDLPIVGNDEAYEQDRLNFLVQLAQEYGEIVRYNESVYIITDPSLINQVLARTDQDFIVPDTNPFQGKKYSIEESVARRKFQRRGQAQAFHHKMIETFTEKIVDITTRNISNWQAGQQILIFEEMKRICSRISIHYILGEDGIPFLSLIYDFVDALFTIYNSPFSFPVWLPTPNKIHAYQLRAQLQQVIDRLIRKRRKNCTEQADVLSMLLHTPTLDNQPLTDKVIFELLILLLFVSSYAPIAALSWMWFLLAQHPEQEHKLHREVEQVLKEHSVEAITLSHFPYVTSVVKETLRLYPPVWQIARIVARDCELLGYTCARGQRLHLNSYVVHRTPHFFPNPDQFIPERWLDEKSLELLPKFSYFPFGGGPHSCLGSALAMTILPLITITVASRFRLCLTDAASVKARPQSLLTPTDFRMTIEPYA